MTKLKRFVAPVGTVLFVVLVLVGFITGSIAQTTKDYYKKQAYINNSIQLYCGGTPKVRNDTRYQLKYWISINRPDSPNVPQGWAATLTEEQIIAVMMITDGVDPICPSSDSSGQ